MSTDQPCTISSEARAEVEKLLAAFKAQFKKDAVPAFLWIDSNLNEGRFESGIGIGYYTNRDEITNDIEVIDGLEIVFAMSEVDRVRFLEKTVHFTHGRFVLV